MASYNRVVDFLPESTELMVVLRPPNDLSPELKNLLSKNVEGFPYKKGKFTVPLHLKEPLKIRFSISEQWKIQKEFKRCACVTPVLPGKELDSVNGAYQAISEVFEPHRLSRGGTVYPKIFYESENKEWISLERKRDQIYEAYQEDYEEKVSIYKNRTIPYVRLHPAKEQFFDALLEQKEKLIQILQSESENQAIQLQKLNQIVKESKIAVYKEKLQELEERLEKNYPETSGDNSWQSWIYKNNWLFATQYAEPLPKSHVGFHNIPDFLFPTLDGFIDILEIKRPIFEVIDTDKSHPGSYKWSREANEAVGQVVNYLYEIELHQLEIVKKIEEKYNIRLSAVKARAVILIGQSNKWPIGKREALRKLNHSLHCIEVITYTDILRRGRRLVEMYGDET